MGMSTQSGSRSPFSEHLSWDVPLNCDYEDEIADHEVLTALVRSSYLKHLHRSLTKNYDLWMEKNPHCEDFSDITLNDIKKCASLLEMKALRACMVTSFYQRAMVTTMREIKCSTEEGSLFSPLLEQAFDSRSTHNTKTDSNSQPDPNINNKTKILLKEEKEIQTNISLLSVKTNANPGMTESKVIHPSGEEHTLENSNLILIRPQGETIQDKQDDIESLFNILMHSPSCSESEAFSTSNRKYSTDSRGYLTESNHSQCEEEDSRILLSNCVNESNLSSINKKMKIPLPESSVTCDLTKTENSLNEMTKSNLDERLEALAALFGRDSPLTGEQGGVSCGGGEATADAGVATVEERPDSAVGGDLRNYSLLYHDWKAEYAAHSCHLKLILSRLSSDQRHKLERRFYELFGSSRRLTSRHSDHEGSFTMRRRRISRRISASQEALGRKRTANIVVGELTPLFISGRIASREVFKLLAKKITDELLLFSYVPDPAEISAKVNSFFENGRCIYSERDINSVIS